jgi:DNA-directed RNA polymerase specialized sigma24 family protein
LKTFFIGQCLMQYPNTYREWRQLNAPPRVDQEELARQLALRTNLPATPAELAELNRRLPEVVKKERSPAFLSALFAAGFSQEEIAAAVGLTTVAVQSKIKRLRKAAA